MSIQDIKTLPPDWLLLAEHKPAYVIVDGAQWHELFVQADHPLAQSQHHKLLKDTPEHEAADYGPIVLPVALEQTQLLEELGRISILKPSVLWFISDLPTQDVVQTLVDKLYHEDNEGRTLLLRYYDPRVLAQLRSVFKKEDWNTLFDGVDYVTCWDTLHGWIAHSKETA